MRRTTHEIILNNSMLQESKEMKYYKVESSSTILKPLICGLKTGNNSKIWYELCNKLTKVTSIYQNKKPFSYVITNVGCWKFYIRPNPLQGVYSTELSLYVYQLISECRDQPLVSREILCIASNMAEHSLFDIGIFE